MGVMDGFVPYEAIDDRCKFNKKNVGATVKSYKDIPH